MSSDDDHERDRQPKNSISSSQTDSCAMDGGPNPPTFATVDWEGTKNRSRPSLSWSVLGLIGSLAVLLAGVVYDRVVTGSGTPIVFGWSPEPIEWLFLASLVGGFWLFVVPFLSDPTLRGSARRGLRRNPVAIASVAYLGMFFLAGTVLVRTVEFDGHAQHVLQPPAFVSVREEIPHGCAGQLENGYCHGTLAYPLGTDLHGENLLQLILEGAQVSLMVAMIVGVFVASIALVVGTTAGYLGGRVDAVLMRYVDVQQTIPAFLVYIVLAYAVGQSLLLLVVVFGLLGWGGIARIVRGDVQRLKSERFVLNARAAGAGPIAILRRHLLPNVVGTAAVATTQFVPRILLIEAALSFMMLTDTTVTSWGHTIASGFQHLRPILDTWWLTTIPVVCLALTVLSIAVLGDLLRDVYDPNY